MLKNRKKKGFTLIELIVVIAILGILAAILIPKFGGFQNKAKSTQALVNAKQIATAIDSLEAEGRTYNESGTDSTTFKVADIQAIAQVDGTLQSVENPTANGDIKITAKTGSDRCSSFKYVYITDNKTFTVERDKTGKFVVTIPTN